MNNLLYVEPGTFNNVRQWLITNSCISRDPSSLETCENVDRLAEYVFSLEIFVLELAKYFTLG